MPNSRRSQPPLALSVPLSRFTSRVGGASAFFVSCAKRTMKRFFTILLLATSVFSLRAQAAGDETNQPATTFSEWQVDAVGRIKVTCKPSYYVRERDGYLVPADEARQVKDLVIGGIVLTVVQPERLAGQVVAFHVDFPEKWDHWYKPDVLYTGTIRPVYIGRLAFMCDPGWRPASTNHVSGTRKNGPANGSQPVGSETNRTSSAAGSGH